VTLLESLYVFGVTFGFVGIVVGWVHVMCILYKDENKKKEVKK
jgi:predicted PurR-regulated permease PerM